MESKLEGTDYLEDLGEKEEFQVFNCKSKLCVFCGEHIYPENEKGSELDMGRSGDFNDKFPVNEEGFLKGVTVVCQLLNVSPVREARKFGEMGFWELLGKDNFVDSVCCVQCFKLLEKVVALHQLLLETQVTLNETVSKIQDTLEESQRKAEDGLLEYSINACVEFRETLLKSKSCFPRKLQQEVNPCWRRRPGPRSKTFCCSPKFEEKVFSRSSYLRDPELVLEKVRPAPQTNTLEESIPDADENRNNIALNKCNDESSDADGSLDDSTHSNPPLKKSSRRSISLRKRISNGSDDDYQPVPKRHRGKYKKPGRPKIHPLSETKKVPGKRGRPRLHPRLEERISKKRGRPSVKRPEKELTEKVIKTQTQKYLQEATIHNDYDSNTENNIENDKDEDYTPDPEELEQLLDTEQDSEPEGKKEYLQVPSGLHIPSSKVGRARKFGSHRYRNEEGPSAVHKPIFVISPSQDLLMFFNVAFRRSPYSLDCLHPNCNHSEPITGYFSDQVAFRNFRFHVRYYHRNRTKTVVDDSHKFYYCHHCQAQLESRERLSEHRLHQHPSITSMPRVLCEMCGDTTSYKNFLRHTITHKNAEEKEAALLTRSRGKYKDITKPLHYPCDQCSKTFKCHTELRTHKVSHIPLELRKQYICDLCGERLATLNNLTYHKRVVHLKQISYPYQCHICSKKYSVRHKTRYEIHMRIHTGEKPFQCSECGKSFIGKEHLAKHEKLHNNEDLVPCEFCAKVYKNAKYLRKHQRQSHGDVLTDKPDPSKTLKAKMLRRTFISIGPELKYPCEPCGHQYPFKSMLITHLKRKHSMDLPRKEDYPTMWTIEDQHSTANNMAI